MNHVDDVLNCLDYLLPIFSNPGREEAMYDFVRKMFMDIGFEDVGLKLIRNKYQIHKMVIRNNDESQYERHVPNLGLSYKGDETKPHLVFNAHLDHYFAGDITRKRIVDGDWLLSDGVNILGADCKAGIALIYVIVKQLLKNPSPPSIDIVFDACEEAGLIGMIEFYEEKQYHSMPFWDRYKKGKTVYCYCFDGLYREEIGKQLLVYVNRASAAFISKYLMNQGANKICDVVNDSIRWRNMSKKEKLLVSSLKDANSLSHDKILVEKYGSGLIILSKIIPTLMFPMGFVDCHTNKEKLYLPYLGVIASVFEKGAPV